MHEGDGCCSRSATTARASRQKDRNKPKSLRPARHSLRAHAVPAQRYSFARRHGQSASTHIRVAPATGDATPNHHTLRGRPRSKQIRVLIADDHAIVRRGLRQILSRHRRSPGSPEKYKRHRSAVPAGTQNHFDVVLMDVSMPHRNGIDALKMMRKEYPRIRFLMLTHVPRRAIRDSGAQRPARPAISINKARPNNSSPQSPGGEQQESTSPPR